MANVTQLSTTGRNAAVEAATDLLDGGNIVIYDDDSEGLPASPQAASTGFLIVELDFSGTAFGAPSTGVVTAAAITPGTAAAAGIASYGRTRTSADAVIHQGNAGETDEAFVFDDTDIPLGAEVSITALTVTQPQ